MATRNLTVHIIGDARSLQRAFRQSSREAATFNAQITGMGRSLARGVGIGAAVTGFASLGLATRNTTQAFIDFESSFAGVRKTVDASEPELQALAEGFRSMAREIPVSVDELNRIGEAAGQLGVQTGAILNFTRTVADLGVTTNLSADEAADALARIANITGLPQQQFDRLGSTIVELGNRMAATESEIVAFSLRLAGAGTTIGLSEAQIAGFGAALASVGIEAEAGGTAFSRVFIELANAVAQGGKDLRAFADIAGVSTAEFRQRFERDGAAAVITFVEGLGRIRQEGGNVFQALERVGLSEIRVRDALLRASNAGDLFRRSLQTGTQAFRENNALTTEAARRYDTTASRLQVFRNRIRDVQITLGEGLAQGLVEGAELAERALNGISQWLQANEEPLRRIWERAATAARVFAAVLGPVVGAALRLIGVYLTIQVRVLDRLTQVWGILARVAAAAVARILNLLDRFLGGLTAVTDAANKVLPGDPFGGVSDSINSARERLRGFAEDLRNVGGQEVTTTVNVQFRTLGAGPGMTPPGDNPLFRAAGGGGAARRAAADLDAATRRTGISAETRNRIFNDQLQRRLNLVQDLPSLQGQLAALDRIASFIEQQITKVRDVTRRLTLRDELLGVRRQQRDIRQQIADAFIDSLQLGVDRAAVTARLSDDLAALNRLEQGVRQQIAAQGRTAALERQLLDITRQRQSIAEQQRQAEQEAAEARRRARQARQFRQLGLTAEGEDPVAGVGALRRRLTQLTERIRTDPGATQKMRDQLRRIARVLSGDASKIGRDVRAAIERMFEEIAGALNDGGQQRGRFVTKGRIADTDDIVRGLGLDPNEVRALRGRLAKIGVGGRTTEAGPGAFGRPVADTGTGGVTITGPVYVVTNDPDDFQRKLQKKARRRATQTTGPNAGNSMGTTR